MSRIGKQFIEIPKQVTVKLEKYSTHQKISVDGPNGNLSRILPFIICCTLDEKENKIFLEKAQDTRLASALYGLTRTLVSNMVVGVSVGFQKKLQISGVGYRAQLDGKDLILNMGYSHPVRMVAPPRVSISLENPTTIIISGVELDVVGEFAAKVRLVRPPEPYKGKGIAYEGETIRMKAGKTGK